MKILYKNKRIDRGFILTKDELKLVKMIFRSLENAGIDGHDDFHNCICIDAHTFDTIKKKYTKCINLERE